jgi:hypothetical protein
MTLTWSPALNFLRTLLAGMNIDLLTVDIDSNSSDGDHILVNEINYAMYALPLAFEYFNVIPRLQDQYRSLARSFCNNGKIHVIDSLAVFISRELRDLVEGGIDVLQDKSTQFEVFLDEAILVQVTLEGVDLAALGY